MTPARVPLLAFVCGALVGAAIGRWLARRRRHDAAAATAAAAAPTASAAPSASRVATAAPARVCDDDADAVRSVAQLWTRADTGDVRDDGTDADARERAAAAALVRELASAVGAPVVLVHAPRDADHHSAARCALEGMLRAVGAPYVLVQHATCALPWAERCGTLVATASAVAAVDADHAVDEAADGSSWLAQQRHLLDAWLLPEQRSHAHALACMLLHRSVRAAAEARASGAHDWRSAFVTRDDARAALRSDLRTVDAALDGREYVLGSMPCTADIVASAVLLGGALDAVDDAPTAARLRDYAQRVHARLFAGDATGLRSAYAWRGAPALAADSAAWF